jgi:hypothetical protein
MVCRNSDSVGKARVKTKRPNVIVQPDYIPPSRLVKCPFDSEQKLFWLETSEWFRAHHRFNEGAKYDDDLNEPQPLYEAFKKSVPEKYRDAVWQVGQSVFQAFNIVQNKDLGVDTKSFPKGATNKGTYNHWEERKKRLSLFLLKHGSALWNPHVYPGIEQAIKENDIGFFRRDIPATLTPNRRKIVCFNPDEPERGSRGRSIAHEKRQSPTPAPGLTRRCARQNPCRPSGIAVGHLSNRGQTPAAILASRKCSANSMRLPGQRADSYCEHIFCTRLCPESP